MAVVRKTAQCVAFLGPVACMAGASATQESYAPLGMAPQPGSETLFRLGLVAAALTCVRLQGEEEGLRVVELGVCVQRAFGLVWLARVWGMQPK